MRLVKQSISRDGSGFATLVPEEPEDMWHAYNLIRPTDHLRSQALRRVKTESATGSVVNHRIKTNLTVSVVSTTFDSAASMLHVSGLICEETAVAPLGSHHTLTLELNRPFTLTKAGEGEIATSGSSTGDKEAAVPGEGWDSRAREILKDALNPDRSAETMAIVMTDGLANICAITPYRTILRQRVEANIPRKQPASEGKRDAAIDKFFKATLDTLLRHLPSSSTSSSNSTEPSTCPSILLASPGFTAASFATYIRTQAITNKTLQSLVPLLVTAHVSSPHIHSLSEALAEPKLAARLHATRFARDTVLLDNFFALLRNPDQEARAWYGHKEVCKAVEMGAVGKGGGVLFVSDRLFRAADVAERKRWVALTEQVREQGGEVRVVSSEHESGKRVEGLGGVCASLVFPLEGLDDDNENDNENA